MTPLTIETVSSEQDHIEFRRSDGQCFSLLAKDNGHTLLVAKVVDLDADISDVMKAAQNWMLAYPNIPA